MYQEVANLKKLSCPGVAKFIDSNAEHYQEDQELYLVMEYIPGRHLGDFVTAGLPDITNAAMIVDGLLVILEHCHTAITVHRDIKPENIILRNDDPKDPVLIDFGLSFNLETQPSEFNTDPSQHLGNRFMILPEYGVRDANKRDIRSDISQCVGILFFLVTGLNPDNIIDGDHQPPHKRAASSEKLRTSLPPIAAQLMRIFDIGFQPELLRRFQSIAALRAEIKKLLSPLSIGLRTFKEILEQTKASILQTPDNVVADRITKINQLITTIFTEFQQVVLKTLTPAFVIHRGIMSRTLPSPKPLWTKVFALKSKYANRLPIQIHFLLVRDEGELLLSGATFLCEPPPHSVPFRPNTSPPLLSNIEGIVRFGIFDPEAGGIAALAFERFFADRVIPVLK